MSVDTTLLTDPKQFFEGRDLGLKIPIGIVLAIILLRIVTAVINALLLTPEITQGMGGGPPAAGDAAVLSTIGGLIVGVIAAVIGPLIAWVLFAAIFYGISEILADDATGDFTDVLSVTAWGFVPRLITVVVALVLVIVNVVLLTVLGLGVSIVTFIGLVGPLVAIVLTLLSAYIWGNGLAVVRGITPKQGYICTLPVVLLGLLVTVLTLLGQLLSALGIGAM